MKIATALLSTFVLLAGSLSLHADTDKKMSDKDVIAEQLPSYPLKSCTVSGNAFGEEHPAKNVVVEGRLIRVCCDDCAATVKKTPAKSVAKIDAAVIKAQAASYPLDTCMISGEKLSAMGEPINYVHGTRLIRVCCKSCVKKVKADPAGALEKVNVALIAQQRETYPLTTCAISGEELGEMGDVIEVLHGTTLVRLCCKGCVKGFKKNPSKVLAKLAAASKKNG